MQPAAPFELASCNRARPGQSSMHCMRHTYQTAMTRKPQKSTHFPTDVIQSNQFSVSSWNSISSSYAVANPTSSTTSIPVRTCRPANQCVLSLITEHRKLGARRIPESMLADAPFRLTPSCRLPVSLCRSSINCACAVQAAMQSGVQFCVALTLWLVWHGQSTHLQCQHKMKTVSVSADIVRYGQCVPQLFPLTCDSRGLHHATPSGVRCPPGQRVAGANLSNL